MAYLAPLTYKILVGDDLSKVISIAFLMGVYWRGGGKDAPVLRNECNLFKFPPPFQKKLFIMILKKMHTQGTHRVSARTIVGGKDEFFFSCYNLYRVRIQMVYNSPKKY